ncbi:MAG: hypothetical protein OXM61_17685 [Candidatus Poribacteria bacterium]|nr:hypothetical protein [Candidatus Poribacteria bacterium]
MNWQKLKELIQSMDKRRKGKKRGEAFERLVIQILESLLKITIIPAKSGSQPSGDARSENGKLSLQAKNYSNSENLNIDSIVRDIHRARKTLPELEVYVLAVSCIFAQDRDELDYIEKDIFLDIVILELTDGISDLGALCVTFWRDLQDFDEFSTTSQNQEFFDWMEKQRQAPKVREKIEELKHRFEQYIQTQNHFQIDAQDIFLKRIGEKPNTNFDSDSIIDLSKVKVRHEDESKLDNWWKNNAFSICFLEGEKNSGKTWLAANWVKSICKNGNIAPIWLEKNQWINIRSLNDLQYASFKSVYGLETDRKIEKLKQKISYSWNNPTLIILDGLRNHDEIDIIKQIIYDYIYESRIGKTKWGHNIFLLLTTLSFDELQNAVNSRWKGHIYCIRVNPLCETESQITLTTENPQTITLQDLWTNLLEKIEDTDLQDRVNLGWGESEKTQEILSRLAKQTKWRIIDTATQFSVQLLKNCFINYQETRQDLREQRIALEADEIHVEVNQDHVKLGWALYLSNLFDSLEFTTIKDFADRFHRELDPFEKEDPPTEALFLALQITAIFPKISQTPLTQKRTALLLVLFNCPNRVLTQERLLFWAEQDTEAYVQFVQSAFKNQILPNDEYELIEPLAKIWRNKKGQFKHLESRLAKWLFPTYSVNSPENRVYTDVDGHQLPMMRYDPQIKLLDAALSILSQRPEQQFLKTLAKCYETLQRYESPVENIGRLMRWGYTETVLDNLHWLPELTEQNTDLLTGVYGLAAELKLANLPILLQRPLSEKDKERMVLAEQWNSTFKPPIDRIRAQEKLLQDDSPDANANGNYHGLDYLAVRTDLPDLHDDDLVKIKEVLQYIADNTELGTGVGATREDYCIENLLPWIAKYDPAGYAELACNLKFNTLNQRWAQFKLLSIQGLIFKPEDCEKITEAILGMKEQLAQGEDFYSDVAWLTHLLTETLLFCATKDVLADWFKFLASHEPLRSSICYEALPYLFESLLPASIVELAQKKLEELRDASHEESHPSDQTLEEFSEVEYWCSLFAYGTKTEDRTVKYALEDLKMRKPDSTGTFPMLRLAYSDAKLFLDETLIDENIQKHLFSQNGRKWIIRPYDGNDVPSYELLRSFIRPEFMGSFLSGPDRHYDLSRWGRDLMKWMFSILNGNEGDSNTVEETLSGINREVLQAWAEQNKADFLQLSDEYLKRLAKSPWYQQVFSDFTDVIHCLLLRFQPEKAEENYQKWSSENVRTIHYNKYGIETFLAQLWKVEQCDSPKHVQLRRTLLEECQSDENIMFMTIAALAGKGKEELWNLTTQKYLKSHYAKERNLGVSILPWFGSDEVIELLDQLKSDDPSLWVRGHAKWSYEVAQQERSCRTVYREALQTHDLFRISAAFERMKPAMSPTARWWHRQIEKELGLISESQEIDPKLIALVDRFWYRWGNSSKIRRSIEILDRKLSEYCRGEKLGFGSPPRLAPWWKPE